MTEGNEAGWELAEEVQTRGNFAYTIARWFPRRSGSRAPLGIAAFIALPLFFCSLMASTLAQEKAHKIQWKGCHSGICTVWHDPTTATEARVWLWALVPSLVLVVVGFIVSRVPLGFYVACVAGIVIAMGVAHNTASWARHHTQRFPLGADLVPDHAQGYAFSNHFNRGEWEKEALSTALSLQHWTIGVALAAIFVMGSLWIRSQFRRRRPGVVGVPGEGVHAQDITPPGL
jgi:hypothetical protein